ncbi:MAG: hypothetical protein ACF8QF_03685 [Phycisphaerales bacterium]
MLRVAGTTLLAGAWLASAGPLMPPAGRVSSTGVTLDELAQAVADADPMRLAGLKAAAYTINGQYPFFSDQRFVTRIQISKSVASAEVYVQLREPGGPVIGNYRLRPDEGSLVAEIDLVVDGLMVQYASVSSGVANVVITRTPAP